MAIFEGIMQAIGTLVTVLSVGGVTILATQELVRFIQTCRRPRLSADDDIDCLLVFGSEQIRDTFKPYTYQAFLARHCEQLSHIDRDQLVFRANGIIVTLDNNEPIRELPGVWWSPEDLGWHLIIVANKKPK